jgi:hypothetical protein
MSRDLALLSQVAQCSSLLVIFGYGDGALVRACCDDRRIREKDIFVVAYPGETVPEQSWPARTKIARVNSWDDMQQWILATFSDHNDIIRIAGGDFLEPTLDGEPAALRDAWRERTIAMMTDRPWALGNDINDSFMGMWHAAQNAARILPAPSIGQLCSAFGAVPAISVGAGPSVGTHLDELRALQDRCLIVACDSVCPGLVKAGIIPHFVTPLERLRQQTQFVECLRGTRAVFAGIPACHPTTVDCFGERVIYMHALDRLYDWLEPNEHLRCMSGSSTGVLSFYVAASITRGPVYLLGHDLAKEDGSSHWKDAAVAGSAFAKEEANAGAGGTNGYEKRLIPGNGGRMLESIMWWDTFRSEIASQAKLIPGRIFNINAYDQKYAVIEHTQAAPLPAPESLPILPDWTPPRRNADRLKSWRTRSATLAQDGERLLAGLAALRTDIAATQAAPPHTWDIEALMRRVTPDSHVSDGNVAVFQYFLRSAIYNEQAYAGLRARGFRSKEQAHWSTLRSLDGLADGMVKAVEHLQPLLRRVSEISTDI